MECAYGVQLKRCETLTGSSHVVVLRSPCPAEASRSTFLDGTFVQSAVCVLFVVSHSEAKSYIRAEGVSRLLAFLGLPSSTYMGVFVMATQFVQCTVFVCHN